MHLFTCMCILRSHHAAAVSCMMWHAQEHAQAIDGALHKCVHRKTMLLQRRLDCQAYWGHSKAGLPRRHKPAHQKQIMLRKQNSIALRHRLNCRCHPNCATEWRSLHESCEQACLGTQSNGPCEYKLHAAQSSPRICQACRACLPQAPSLGSMERQGAWNHRLSWSMRRRRSEHSVDP
jgi:hypothetical protein